MRTRVLVTGATGQIGREVVGQLHAAGMSVRALSRNPHAASVPEGVEIVAGDLAAADTLDAALDDVGPVFLVWPAPFTAAAPAIDRLAARAERIVFLSAPIRTEHPFFQQPNPLRQVFAGVEDLIARSGIPSTILRPGPFALNCRNWWAPQIRTGDVVRWFHADAQTAAVHEGDIAAVAVRALCEAQHAGGDYVLTGPESLTQRAQLAIIGDAMGRTLVFDDVAPDTARREVIANWPPAAADMLLRAYAAAVDVPALVTRTIEEITGTPARTFRQWAMDHRSEFAA